LHTLSPSFVLGYHGCDAKVAEALLQGKPFRASTNVYDWLGHGIYFWENNPLRGLKYARKLKEKPIGRTNIKNPYVIGAVIDLGLCLDLTTATGVEQVGIAHKKLVQLVKKAEGDLPENFADGRHKLDCAVLQALHGMREESGERPIDTVKGLFIEGDKIYPTAEFHKETHIQICVRNPDCIIGVFRVQDRFLQT
jgi:hypothetical protein